MGRSIGLLFARCALACLFLYTGWESLFHLSGVAADLQAKGYPAPKVFAVVATAAELLGGLSLILGALTPLGCLALILFLVPTTYSFHLAPALHASGDAQRSQMISVLKNLGLIGGLIALYFSGPGSLSVDARWFRRGDG
jgi:putative oxidoreductase